MSLIDIILNIILISVFCLGIRTLLSDGMILHFLREPFEYDGESKVMNFLKRKIQRRALRGENGLQVVRRDYTKISNKISFLLKPILLCVICFSSFWGSTVFVVVNGFQIKELIICCIGATFIIKFVNDKVDL